jgi:outer membrane immunogenic protein
MRLSGFLMLAVLAGGSTTVIAQAAPAGSGDLGPTVSKESPIAVSVSYTAMVGNSPPGTCGCFLLNGGSSEGVFHVWRNVAAVAQVAGNRSGQIPNSIQGLSLVTYMGGPRYSYLVMHRFTAYGQFLAGGVHGFDSYFPNNDAKSTGAADSFAIAPGGGLEVGVRSWLSVRAVEAEYLMTRLPNSADTDQHNLRVSSGVVFRFSTARLTR